MARGKERYLDQGKGGVWIYQRRVAADLVKRIGKRVFKQSLKTDSLREALPLRDQLNAQIERQWAALRSGNPAQILRDMDILPERHTVPDLPVDPMTREFLIGGAREKLYETARNGSGPEDIEKYLKSLPIGVANTILMRGVQTHQLKTMGLNGEEIAEAIKATDGEIKGSSAGMKVSKALSSYLEREALEITSKHSQNQKRTFENQKRRSVSRFIEVVGDRPILSITRQQANAFHQFWHNRIYNPAEGQKAYSSGAGIKDADRPQDHLAGHCRP